MKLKTTVRRRLRRMPAKKKKYSLLMFKFLPSGVVVVVVVVVVSVQKIDISVAGIAAMILAHRVLQNSGYLCSVLCLTALNLHLT